MEWFHRLAKVGRDRNTLRRPWDLVVFKAPMMGPSLLVFRCRAGSVLIQAPIERSRCRCSGRNGCFLLASAPSFLPGWRNW